MAETGDDPEQAVWFSTQIGLLMYIEDLIDHNGSYFLKRSKNGRGPLIELLIEIKNSSKDMDRLFNFLRALGMENPVGEFSDVPLISNYWFSIEKTIPIELSDGHLDMLIDCASYDWSEIDPVIFGAIVESCYTDSERLKGGIHFTREDDVRKIVRPLITDYWVAKLDSMFDNISNHTHPKTWKKRRFVAVSRALQELYNFKILEPACGCGNFLYVAYRELKDIEDKLIRMMRTIPGQEGYMPGMSLTPSKLTGYEIQPWSAQIARLVMSIGYCRTQIEFRWGNPFPLNENLATIEVCDALIDGDSLRTWADCDVIIGNPPFSGTTLQRQRLGEDYVKKIHTIFSTAKLLPRKDIDFVGYWFLIAQKQLIEGRCLAFGFISTRAIIQTQSRLVLQHGLDNGLRISIAYRDRQWIGKAGVHISIICMERRTPPYWNYKSGD